MILSTKKFAFQPKEKPQQIAITEIKLDKTKFNKKTGIIKKKSKRTKTRINPFSC